MVQAITCRPLSTEARVRAQASRRGNFGGQRGIGTGLSSSSSIFLCQDHSTVALHTHVLLRG
jgi:hypothetical protein